MEKKRIAFNAGALPLGIRSLFQGADVYDSSCSELARTLFVDGPKRCYVKIGTKSALESEAIMGSFLHRHRLSPEPFAYETDDDHDYLVTEAIDGEDGTDPAFLEQPAKLAFAFGEHLRMLHTLPLEGCPYPNRTNELLVEHRSSKIYSPATDPVVMHGDYCLPNIILIEFAFRAFIDVGHGGVGDRHYDLTWGLWSLQHNLKSDAFGDHFLNGYGRTYFDDFNLRYFRNLIR
ncbi:aminoglycoside 3'-phosphotransferase [Paenibacillus methanolicus]|uniref:Kanamycin kinase n=1 Tax=Paenibacillus methanolicus TaxID=582686 RepID=A0A5S5CJF0_9BACL|nr:aminoglycoside 3'-phosphotransferase [Paenibacillus methanolicus]TYP79027.1 kanamycin kinase [Paenibacillus methanolicus]